MFNWHFVQMIYVQLVLVEMIFCAIRLVQNILFSWLLFYCPGRAKISRLDSAKKKPEQKLDKKWTQDFFDSPTGNPATGQKMDNFTILVNLLFVHLLSWCHTLPILPFYNDIACFDKSWTSSRHSPERFPID